MGVDPGLTGAIALIDAEGKVEMWDMPVKKYDGKNHLNNKALHRLFGTLAHATRLCTIEEARGFPGQSSVTGFKQGVVYGQTLAAAEVMGIPNMTVLAFVWKKNILAGYKDKRDKKVSVAHAVKLFPSVEEYLYGPKGGVKDGRAEALLLAEYGRRVYSS